MVKIDICQKCDHKMSEIWKEHTSCLECGGPLEKIDVDMGFAERAPRILMVGGVGFSLFAILYLLYKMVTSDFGQDQGLTSMVMFLVGIGFFAASLIVRTQVSSKAIEMTPSSTSVRRQKKVRSPRTREKEPVMSGSIEHPRKRTASKLPIERK